MHHARYLVHARGYYEVFDFMDRYFWEAGQNAYADERDISLENLSAYRGQNANMQVEA